MASPPADSTIAARSPSSTIEREPAELPQAGRALVHQGKPAPAAEQLGQLIGGDPGQVASVEDGPAGADGGLERGRQGPVSVQDLALIVEDPAGLRPEAVVQRIENQDERGDRPLVAGEMVVGVPGRRRGAGSGDPAGGV